MAAGAGKRDHPTLEELGIGLPLVRWQGISDRRNQQTQFDKSDFRNIVPRFSQENREANQVLVDLIGEFAKQKNATPAQVALAWRLTSGAQSQYSKR
jgi:aryl-alcohol dehydrogenase-like predicted oxidoreductase